MKQYKLVNCANLYDDDNFSAQDHGKAINYVESKYDEDDGHMVLYEIKNENDGDLKKICEWP